MINLISLPDEKLKLELVKNNFNNYKIEYKIFDGIDGTNYVYTPDDTKYLKNVNFNIKKKKGVFGCLLSHIKLLTTFINSSLDYIIVSEDNIQIVQDDIHEILKDIIANVSFSIIFLCCLEKPPDTKLNRKLNSKYSLYDMDHHIDKDNVPHCDWYGQGARLYIISRGGASELLSSYYKKEFKFAIDWEMIYDITNPLIIYPSLCSYNNKNSSINKRGGH